MQPFYYKRVTMKKIFYLLPLVLIIFVACEKKEESNLSVKITQAFAFATDENWEVNVPATVKGFKTKGEEGNRNASLSYSIDVTNPQGKTFSKIYSGKEEINLTEVKDDITIDVQFYLDTTYVPGDYKITLNLIDEFSKNKATGIADLQLSN